VQLFKNKKKYNTDEKILQNTTQTDNQIREYSMIEKPDYVVEETSVEEIVHNRPDINKEALMQVNEKKMMDIPEPPSFNSETPKKAPVFEDEEGIEEQEYDEPASEPIPIAENKEPFLEWINNQKHGIVKEIEELHELENNWKALNANLKNVENKIRNKISQIKSMTGELKRVDNLKKKLNKQEYFYSSNGEEYKSINDLVHGLKKMPLQVYRVHVAGNRNDFANWIMGVFNNHELGNQLKSTDSKKEMIKILKGI